MGINVLAKMALPVLWMTLHLAFSNAWALPVRSGAIMESVIDHDSLTITEVGDSSLNVWWVLDPQSSPAFNLFRNAVTLDLTGVLDSVDGDDLYGLQILARLNFVSNDSNQGVNDFNFTYLTGADLKIIEPSNTSSVSDTRVSRAAENISKYDPSRSWASKAIEINGIDMAPDAKKEPPSLLRLAYSTYKWVVQSFGIYGKIGLMFFFVVILAIIIKFIETEPA